MQIIGVIRKNYGEVDRWNEIRPFDKISNWITVRSRLTLNAKQPTILGCRIGGKVWSHKFFKVYVGSTDVNACCNLVVDLKIQHSNPFRLLRALPFCVLSKSQKLDNGDFGMFCALKWRRCPHCSAVFFMCDCCAINMFNFKVRHKCDL